MSFDEWNELYEAMSLAMIWLTAVGIIIYPHQVKSLVLLLLKALGAVTIAYLFHAPERNMTGYFPDWLWTTSLSLLILWHLAHADLRRSGFNHPVLLIGVNLLMLIAGLISVRANDAVTKWMFLAVSLLALGYVFGEIWGQLRKQAIRQLTVTGQTFILTASTMIAAWIGFPLLLFMGPYAFAWMDEQTVMIWIAGLHVLTKAIFFLIVSIGVVRMGRER